MQGEKINVTLSKIGTTELSDKLEDFIIVPLPDKEDFNGWKKVFDAWPKKPGVMEAVTIHEAIYAGLKTLARAAKQQEMIKEWRAENSSGNGKRGRGKKSETVTL